MAPLCVGDLRHGRRTVNAASIPDFLTEVVQQNGSRQEKELHVCDGFVDYPIPVIRTGVGIVLPNPDGAERTVLSARGAVEKRHQVEARKVSTIPAPISPNGRRRPNRFKNLVN